MLRRKCLSTLQTRFWLYGRSSKVKFKMKSTTYQVISQKNKADQVIEGGIGIAF